MNYSKYCFILVSLAINSGCSKNHQQNPASYKDSQTKTIRSDGSELFTATEVGLGQGNVKKNQASNMSRKEQIGISLEAAISNKVEPILNKQPLSRTVYFKFSSSVSEVAWQSLLKEHVDYISTDLSIRLLVAGFTDNIGSSKFNLDLGKKRAEYICKSLVNLGARKEQLTCVSYGEAHPADPGKDASSRARNRRVELFY